MIRAFLLSVAQLADPAVLRVLATSLGVTCALFAVLGAGAWWALDALLAAWASGVRGGGTLAGVAAIMLAVLAGWLLFRAVAVLVLGLFGDAIVAAVERRHYPDARARAVPLARSLRMGLGPVARVVGVNLLLAPAYLALLATGVGTAALFFVVNAWLLGRDLGDMVAARHLPPATMRGWRRATAARRFVLGLAGTGLFVVPGVNILAPVLGAAMATHLYHGRRP
jgi:CysZ protein